MHLQQQAQGRYNTPLNNMLHSLRGLREDGAQDARGSLRDERNAVIRS